MRLFTRLQTFTYKIPIRCQQLTSPDLIIGVLSVASLGLYMCNVVIVTARVSNLFLIELQLQRLSSIT